MKRAKIFAAVIYAMLVMGTITFVHFPDLQADEAQAKIGAAQARETALRVVHGTVKNSELETEHGRLVYSFEIARPGEHGITEVNVSAMDGSIVDVHREHSSSRRTSPGKGELRRSNSAHKVEQCQNITSGSASHRDAL
jgi:Peptidase propeptide and YPEB domain